MRSPLQAPQVSGHQSPDLATPLCYSFSNGTMTKEEKRVLLTTQFSKG